MATIPTDIFKPETQNDKASISVLIITADGTEDTEFFYPYYRFLEEGYKVDVCTPGGGEFKGKNGSGLKETLPTAEVTADDYDFVFIPGGKAPEALKDDNNAVELVKNFAAQGKIIAAICHGPQLLAKADVIKDKAIAGWPEIKDEVVKAGAMFQNDETCEDGNFITARWPGDLPTFTRTVLDTYNKLGRAKKVA